MKKILMIAFALLLVLPLASAINVEVEKISRNEVYVVGIDKPAVFELNITNQGQSDNFIFYNLVGFEMLPSEPIAISRDETKLVSLEVKPIGEIDDRGFYTFSYFIRATSDNSDREERLTFKIIDFDEAFEVGSGDVDTDSSSIDIFIRNMENIDLGVLDVNFKSPFFSTEETFSLGPRETKTFTVQLNREDFRSLLAGFYTLQAEITSEEGISADVEGVIKFREKDLITSTKKDFGFFINTQVIEKTNEGNLVAESETVVKKNILSRLFTTLSPEPDVVERQGMDVYYTWTNEIQPGETFAINVRTNWLFPFLVILFIVFIVIIVKKYSGENIVLRKKVSFVRAKGGEFALRVSLTVQARKHLERVNIIDRLPSLVKVYDHFGSEKPTRVDEKTRRIEWNFEKLEPGELRVLSYVIYSKVGVMGKFALPTATAVFEKEGVIHEAESNRAYFVTEPVSKEETESE